MGFDVITMKYEDITSLIYNDAIGMQKNVIFLRELGSQIHLDLFMTTRAAPLLKLIKIV